MCCKGRTSSSNLQPQALGLHHLDIHVWSWTVSLKVPVSYATSGVKFHGHWILRKKGFSKTSLEHKFTIRDLLYYACMHMHVDLEPSLKCLKEPGASRMLTSEICLAQWSNVLMVYYIPGMNEKPHRSPLLPIGHFVGNNLPVSVPREDQKLPSRSQGSSHYQQSCRCRSFPRMIERTIHCQTRWVGSIYG